MSSDISKSLQAFQLLLPFYCIAANLPLIFSALFSFIHDWTWFTLIIFYDFTVYLYFLACNFYLSFLCKALWMTVFKLCYTNKPSLFCGFPWIQAFIGFSRTISTPQNNKKRIKVLTEWSLNKRLCLALLVSKAFYFPFTHESQNQYLHAVMGDFAFSCWPH